MRTTAGSGAGAGAGGSGSAGSRELAAFSARGAATLARVTVARAAHRAHGALERAKTMIGPIFCAPRSLLPMAKTSSSDKPQATLRLLAAVATARKKNDVRRAAEESHKNLTLCGRAQEKN